MKKISDEQLLTILKDVENLHWDGVRFIWRVRPYRVEGKKRLMKGTYVSPERILEEYRLAENKGCLKSQYDCKYQRKEK